MILPDVGEGRYRVALLYCAKAADNPRDHVRDIVLGRRGRGSVTRPVGHPSSVTTPRPLSTVTRCPSAIARVAPCAPTTAGMPYSRATIAQ